MSNKPAGQSTVHATGPKLTADTPFAAKATDAHPAAAEPTAADAPAVDDKPAEDAPAKESKPRKYIGKVGSLSEDVAKFVRETQDNLTKLTDRVGEINEKSAPDVNEAGAAHYLRRVLMATEDLTRALQGVQATNNDLAAAVASV